MVAVRRLRSYVLIYHVYWWIYTLAFRLGSMSSPIQKLKIIRNKTNVERSHAGTFKSILDFQEPKR